MTTRQALLIHLLHFDTTLSPLLEALRTYGWDSETALITLTRADIISILHRYLQSQLNTTDVESWANAIECREDIGFESNYNGLIREVIHTLANPMLTVSLSKETARLLINTLS